MLHQSLKTVKNLTSNAELFASISRRFLDMFVTFPVPLYLRVAFHDAGTFDVVTKKGGPNASVLNSIEMNRTENSGFLNIKDTYLNIKTENPAASMADIIQIGGYVAVSHCGGPVMPFRFGRVDCSGSESDTDGQIPFPSTKNIRAIFRNMGFSDVELVALSGAHTLGGIRFNPPGTFTPFTTNPLVFDNSYFKLLLQTKNPQLARLISDSFLTVDPDLLNIVQQFANDQNLFFSEYTKAHVKLSELGYH
ncbi:unnamed protein product [Blepharisma stoltei]|uniref:Plant heme peroxidase family profile domain-containing protein n=1 Tax=Blepharisma stoltei TaxID=1481888 RepID=A0AAU9IZK6_9CILI|nr:unnamed protein product [Blepharisma stoltei]